MKFDFLNDEETKLGWKANLAMSFYDVYRAFQAKNKKNYVSRKELHEIANEAALHFLSLLTTPLEKENI